MKLDWRVVLGGMGILVLIVIGSYFGRYWHHQSDDERLKPPPTISNVPTTPIDSHPTVRGTDPDSAPEIATTEATKAVDASDAGETEQLIRKSIVQLRKEKAKVEAEIDQITHLGNETTREWGRAQARMGKELPAKQKALNIEVNRLKKIIESKLPLNPTFEDYQSIEEWRQVQKLLRENDSVEATLALEKTYSQKMDEIEQKMDGLFEERSVIMDRIKDLALQLEAEGAE